MIFNQLLFVLLSINFLFSWQNLSWISIRVNIPTLSAKTQRRKEAKVGMPNSFVFIGVYSWFIPLDFLGFASLLLCVFALNVHGSIFWLRLCCVGFIRGSLISFCLRLGCAGFIVGSLGRF